MSSFSVFRSLAPRLGARYSSHVAVRQKTLTDIKKLYNAKEPLAVITAHDYITGRIADSSEKLDIILIGDSLAMVSKGYASTLEIPFDDYYYACKSVLRGVNQKFVIADLPFGSFEASVSQCVESAVKLMKLGKIGSLKVEGGFEHGEQIKRLIEIGIPVTGHIGLKPQQFNAVGGYRVQGRKAQDAANIIKEAEYLRDIGCSMLLLECIPHKVAQYLTEKLDIPTIGIGSGPGTSAQVLVQADLLGMLDSPTAKFVQKYMDFHSEAVNAIEHYVEDVKSGTFPNVETHSYPIKEEEFEAMEKLLQQDH
ncbi:hypothetical protein KL925_000851 [Ogataea polymorpha]|uniref:3-methyl-2-oxobutanoate hydroxymethyltransferase n=1 Tax=Ogataea polymorpha TaxID=460523 RepID=A0A9P8PDN2_9ASCO|nr:hypothetical protein KL937_004328 [Ogataea polymorpha]KAG7892677.1 hypothetical protein KL936_000851 [Ogataea polymorpha]KAG7896674.1 hypothetical protein KL908_000076 [Ogataea polymorpha]KAG7903523.1 hypothetical protein KL935_001055 [Ogataea polymorpha]KAG7913556.1 hypothetical protein KL907_000501 [Ogataea polymorpha]